MCEKNRVGNKRIVDYFGKREEGGRAVFLIQTFRDMVPVCQREKERPPTEYR